jgi:hypothetical protein
MQLISGHNGGQYFRLMAISVTEMLGTVPLGTFYIVVNARSGVTPWKGWASMHSHYSEVGQVAGFTWKNVPEVAIPVEMFRWSLVACAFVFFALYGFTAEAREAYYRLYKLLARHISTSSSASHGAPRAYVVRSLSCLRPASDSFGLILYIFFQYSINPLCQEKRWRRGSYNDPNGPG